MKFEKGDKVVLKANPAIHGVIVDRPEKTKNVNFFNDNEIVWVDTDTIGVAWAYKHEVLATVEATKPALPVKKAKPMAKAPRAPKTPKVPVESVDFRRLIATDLIRKQGGRFFTAIFTGKDGARHTCNGRTGVIKYLKGDVNKQLPNDLLNAFNVHKMEYRNIFLDGIVEIRAEGKVFTFNGGI